MAKNLYLINLLFLFLSSLQVISCYPKRAKGMFVFGSSLVDNGNNNYLQLIGSKADFLPYGLDLPHGQPTGRFTNGRNFIDCLGENLKLPSYIPVFYNPSTKGKKIIHGVNFASGGSGILDETGKITGNVTSMKQQIQNFEKHTLPDLRRMRIRYSDYLFVIGTGGNDYSLNFYKGRSNLTLEGFTDRAISTLSAHIEKLYSLGARKFVVIAIYPNGCNPNVRNSTGCVEHINKGVNLYNKNLKTLMYKKRFTMPRSNFVFFDAYHLMLDIIKTSMYPEFLEKNSSCCKPDVIGTLCTRGTPACANRDHHVFFDGLHPTEAVNVLMASKAYSSRYPKSYVYPMSVRQLSYI